MQIYLRTNIIPSGARKLSRTLFKTLLPPFPQMRENCLVIFKKTLIFPTAASIFEYFTPFIDLLNKGFFRINPL
jgi:hypothetical protein